MSDNDYNEFGFPVCPKVGSKPQFDPVAATVDEEQQCSAMGSEHTNAPSAADLEAIDKATATAEANQDEHAFNFVG